MAYPVERPSGDGGVVVSDLYEYFRTGDGPRLRFGVVADLNRPHEKFLGRQSNNLEKVVSSMREAAVNKPWDDNDDEHDDSVYVDIKLCSLGASLWIPIRSISFIADVASKTAQQHCQSVVMSSLSRVKTELFQEWRNVNKPPVKSTIEDTEVEEKEEAVTSEPTDQEASGPSIPASKPSSPRANLAGEW